MAQAERKRPLQSPSGLAALSPYTEYTRLRAEKNPCLRPLVSLLTAAQFTKTRSPAICSVEYGSSSLDSAEVKTTTLEDALQDVGSPLPQTVSSGAQSQKIDVDLQRLILVEDIDASTIAALGSRLDIDPTFFAHYIYTDVKDIAFSRPIPSMVLLPSTFLQKGSFHLHYQQIQSLVPEAARGPPTYEFTTDANVTRSVRCPPPVSGTQTAIMRGCCSAILKYFHNGWICM